MFAPRQKPVHTTDHIMQTQIDEILSKLQEWGGKFPECEEPEEFEMVTPEHITQTQIEQILSKFQEWDSKFQKWEEAEEFKMITPEHITQTQIEQILSKLQKWEEAEDFGNVQKWEKAKEFKMITPEHITQTQIEQILSKLQRWEEAEDFGNVQKCEEAEEFEMITPEHIPSFLRGRKDDGIRKRLMLTLHDLVRRYQVIFNLMIANARGEREHPEKLTELRAAVKRTSAELKVYEKETSLLEKCRSKLGVAKDDVHSTRVLLEKIKQHMTNIDAIPTGASHRNKVAKAELAKFKKTQGMSRITECSVSNTDKGRGRVFEKKAIDGVLARLFGDTSHSAGHALTPLEGAMFGGIELDPNVKYMFFGSCYVLLPGEKIQGLKREFDGLVVELDEDGKPKKIVFVLEAKADAGLISDSYKRILKLTDHLKDHKYIILQSATLMGGPQKKGLEIRIPISSLLPTHFVFVTTLGWADILFPVSQRHLLLECLAKQVGLTDELIEECEKPRIKSVSLFVMYEAAAAAFMQIQPLFKEKINYVTGSIDGGRVVLHVEREKSIDDGRVVLHVERDHNTPSPSNQLHYSCYDERVRTYLEYERVEKLHIDQLSKAKLRKIVNSETVEECETALNEFRKTLLTLHIS